VAYSIDFMWKDTCCIFCFVATSSMAYSFVESFFVLPFLFCSIYSLQLCMCS
jgi:hypothetical protein